MCKISVGYKLTRNVVKNLTEPAEQGAGVVAIVGNTILSCINKNGKLVRRFIRRELYGKTDFFLYHSRLPSAGTVSDANTQPFIDMRSKVAFGHNGTLNIVDLLPLAIAAKVPVDTDWSDSRVLYHILKRVSAPMRRTILGHFEGNYVWVDFRRGTVELWGKWRRQYRCARTTYRDGESEYIKLRLPLDKAKMKAIPAFREPSYSFGGVGRGASRWESPSSVGRMSANFGKPRVDSTVLPDADIHMDETPISIGKGRKADSFTGM